MRIIISCLLMLLLSVPALPSETASFDEISRKAETAYKAADYNEAITLYRQLLESGNRSAGVYFNLGNAYTKSHDYGNAVLCYERARRLEPQNDEINNNLDYVSAQVNAQNRADLKGKPIDMAEEEPWFLRSIYNSIAVDVKSDNWAWFAGLSFILFILFTADYILVKQVVWRKIGFFGAISMLCCSVLFLVFAFSAAKESRRDNYAVIMAQKIQLLADPNDKAKTTTTYLNRGTKVEIIKTEGGVHDHPEWYNVRLNSENAGWIKAAEIEKIQQALN